mgnify:CR=1 FL=1
MEDRDNEATNDIKDEGTDATQDVKQTNHDEDGHDGKARPGKSEEAVVQSGDGRGVA